MARMLVRDYGTALKFGANTTDRVVWTNAAGVTAPTLSTPVTLAGWFKLNADGGNSALSQVMLRYYGYYIYVRAFSTPGVSKTNQVKLRYDNGSAQEVTAGLTSDVIPPGNRSWHHFIGVVDPTNPTAVVMKMYLDGVLYDTQTKTVQAGTILETNGGRVGNTGTTTPFNGLIDNVKVYHYAFSDTDAANLYFRGADPTAITPIAFFNFNEGAGTTTLDSSGNGSNGTITGATYTSDVVMKPRTLGTNRLAVRDYKAALNFPAITSVVTNTNAVTGFDAASSISLWVKTGTDITTLQRIVQMGIASASTVLGISVSLGIIRAGYYNGTVYVGPVGFTAKPGTWYHLVVTWDGTSTKFYANGQNITTTVGSPSLFQAAGVRVGHAGNGMINYNVADTRVWTRALSAAEVSTLYFGGAVSTTSQWLVWPMNEGAGVTTNDTSGNGNTGTITGATFTSDTPSKARQLVGGNLVKNGDFEYAPPFTAATNTAHAGINGTAAGAIDTSIFGWGIPASALTATASAQFDTSVSHSGAASMKLAVTDATGAITVANFYNNPPTATELIPVLPNTSYTFTGWVQTTTASASGAFIDVREYTGALGTAVTNSTNKLSGTNAWTQVSVTFATNATTRYIGILLRLNVAGQAQTAWFDDISLTPTVNTTRTLVM